MICPNMATMLGFICTDAAVEPELLQRTLLWCVERSFNCVTVDGDMSTNDTVAVMANGASGAPLVVTEQDAGYAALQAALLHVTQDLARQIAFDGEGATKAATIQVTGAKDFELARAMGKAVANYTLFRAMLYGMDYNWGRVAAAMGASLLEFDPAEATISLQGIRAWDRGAPVEVDLKAARAALRTRDILVELDLGQGEGEATVWTCDLTPQYVEFNAEYESADTTTDPGG
jgi:glutamate N-acetyltransferase/amino-acid N-acetyltransferase